MSKIVIGNWKMYKTGPEARQFIKEFARIDEVRSADVSPWTGLAVPFTLIDDLQKQSKELNCSLNIGAQNMHSADQGAFTGEIAVDQLLDVKAQFAILGHSERRLHFHEDDAFINKKVFKALCRDFRAVVCIGDTIDDQRGNSALNVLKSQLQKTLADIPIEKTESLLIAYEPVWAIGTGQSAPVDQMAETCDFCLQWLRDRFPGKKIPLLYGGSVNEKNVGNFAALSQIDGILVGGGSLQATEFAALKSAFSQ